MKINKYLFVFFIYFLNFSSLHSIEPDVFVQSTVNRASKVLSENISKDDKIEKLKKIAIETVDIDGIGLYTLGSARKSLHTFFFASCKLCLYLGSLSNPYQSFLF